MTYTFFLKQTWNDPRLAFDPMDNITDIYLTPDVLSMIWKPDTFFYGFTDIKQHPDFNNGGNTGVSRIKSNGNVEYNVRFVAQLFIYYYKKLWEKFNVCFF